MNFWVERVPLDQKVAGETDLISTTVPRLGRSPDVLVLLDSIFVGTSGENLRVSPWLKHWCTFGKLTVTITNWHLLVPVLKSVGPGLWQVFELDTTG